MSQPPDRARQRVHEERTKDTGWPGVVVWGLAFWATDPEEEDNGREFGGPDRSIWDRLGINELTGLGPPPKER